MCSASQVPTAAGGLPPTRGVRNNNPLNIRIGNSWLGETECNTDGVFEQYTSMSYGLRAAFCLMRRYIVRYRIDTIAGIVSRWAPEEPKLLQMYIDYVSTSAQIAADKQIGWDSCDVLAIVKAMSYYESHYVPTADELIQAYKLAGGEPSWDDKTGVSVG